MANVSTDVAQAWMKAVMEGMIRSTTVLTEDRTVCGRALSRGAQIDVWLEMDALSGGQPRPRARIAGGEELPVQFDLRRIGDFRLILNRLRQIRPNAPKNPPIGRQADFSSGGQEFCPFECLHPRTPMSLHDRTAVLVVTLKNGMYAVLPNANPIEPRGHVLLVPMQENGTRRYPHRPQALTRHDVEDLLAFQEMNPSFIVFFNSIHAGGTVDHIHAHGVYKGDELLAIEKAVAESHFTSDKKAISLSEYEYPARGLVFRRNETAAEIYPYIERLQYEAIPFNFLATSQSIFLIPRDRNHEVVSEFSTAVLASLELAGMLITDRESVYEETNQDQIDSALRRTTLEAF
jgi:ATP adenylyltransferase-like protein